MNRTDELLELQNQLNTLPLSLENTLDRAQSRLEKTHRITRLWIRRGLGGVAACFGLFVMLVNFCMPVAYACSTVPVLRELAEAVTFSRSLTDAVKNEYVQPVNLTQTSNGVTANVEYLIVDQKQVHVFFRLESDKYTKLDVDGYFSPDQETHFEGMAFGSNDWNVPVGTLQSVSLDLFDQQTPSKLLLQLRVYDSTPRPPESGSGLSRAEALLDDNDHRPEYVAQFHFELTFDPEFITQGKIYPIDKEVDIGGQILIIRQLEVYPTHMRILTRDHPDNTAWIRFVKFTVQGDWGLTFGTEATGLTAYGRNDEFTYNLQSPWFYRCDTLNLSITEATLTAKESPTVCLDLTTGETDIPLPAGYELWEANHHKNGWVVSFRGPRWDWDHQYQMFDSDYFDEDRNSYTITSYATAPENAPQEGWEDWQYTTFGLKDYHKDKVWLQPMVSNLWQTESPLIVPVK